MKSKRKFQVGDEVMSRGVCDMWSAVIVAGYDGHGYYLVMEKTGPAAKRPYLAHATNLRKARLSVAGRLDAGKADCEA